jgi:hypothetical protein
MRKMLPPADAYPATNFNGEIESHWRDGYFLIKTPRSKWAVGTLPGGQDLQLGDGVTLRLDNARFACVTLTSLDNLPLAQSQKMRLATVSDIEQDGMYYNRKWQQPRQIKRDAALLCRPVKGEFRFPENTGNAANTPLLLTPKTTGSATAAGQPATPTTVTRGKLRFEAPALVYEIIAAPESAPEPISPPASLASSPAEKTNT